MEAILGAIVILGLLVLYVGYELGSYWRPAGRKDLAFTHYLDASSPEEFENSLQGVPPEQLKKWVREFRAIEKDIGRLVVAGGAKKYSKSHLRAELARRHPSFGRDALHRAVREIVRAGDSK